MNTFRRPAPFRGPRRGPPPPDAHRINDRISSKEVRVISETGEQLGILATRAAITMAEEIGLDLVEVSPNVQPPVCRIMDYGKFKYKAQKKEAEAKKKRTETVIKEIRLRYRTDIGDLETKLNQAREFLEEGNKVKFTMRFKGRENMYRNLGMEKFDEVIKLLADAATVDDRSPAVGAQLHVTFAPIKK